MERLKIYRATSKEQPSEAVTNKAAKEDYDEYVPPASVIIRKPLLPLALPENGKAKEERKEEQKNIEKPRVDVNLPKKVVVVRNAPFVPGFKINTECTITKVETSPVGPLPSLPVTEVNGRPKRWVDTENGSYGINGW